MLIRRLLLFFGIFFELPLLDSITVLPMFCFVLGGGGSLQTRNTLKNKNTKYY